MAVNTKVIAIDDNEVVVETEFTIYYSTEKFVPVPKIIDALKAIESTLNKTPKFVEAAYPEIKVYESNVFINHLESGSLELEVVLRQVLGDVKYERGAKLVDEAKTYIKEVVSDNKTMNNIVIFGMGAIVATGINIATGTKQQPQPAPVTIINNGIMNGSGNLVLTPEQAQNVLDKLPQKQIAKDAVNFTKPAKDDPKSSIDIQDESNVTQIKFDSDVIKNMPESYEAPTPQEKETAYTNTPIAIFASDKDKQSSGWAGIIPTIIDKRISFEIDESINPSQLHGRLNANADLIVYERFNSSKKRYEPYKAVITKIT